MRWTVFAALTIVLCAVPSAAAETQAERVQRLYDQAQARYREGRFHEAAAMLRDLYALEPQPILLYNLARALEGAGDLPETIEAYERYLSAAPTAPNRREIRQRVATLRRQLEERAALERAAQQARKGAPTPEAPPAPVALPQAPQAPALVEVGPARSPPASRARRAAPWLIAGVGALVLGTGGLLAGLGTRANDDATADPLLDSAQARRSDAEHLVLGGNVSFAVGSVMVAVGAVWGIADAVRARRRVTRR